MTSVTECCHRSKQFLRQTHHQNPSPSDGKISNVRESCLARSHTSIFPPQGGGSCVMRAKFADACVNLRERARSRFSFTLLILEQKMTEKRYEKRKRNGMASYSCNRPEICFLFAVMEIINDPYYPFSSPSSSTATINLLSGLVFCSYLLRLFPPS